MKFIQISEWKWIHIDKIVKMAADANQEVVIYTRDEDFYLIPPYSTAVLIYVHDNQIPLMDESCEEYEE
jgi:hypothetical protein